MKAEIKHYTPTILLEIAEFLRSIDLKSAPAINGEGRVASLQDEETIFNSLQTEFGPNTILEPGIWRIADNGQPEKIETRTPAQIKAKKKPARLFADMIVFDGKNFYPVNIKTTTGAADNAFSKLGLLYAFTDLNPNEFPGKINEGDWYDLLMNNAVSVPGRDYWFLCLHKHDMNNVTIRGAKQLNDWGSNPSNDLQIDWGKEKLLSDKEHSFTEALELMLDRLAVARIKREITNSGIAYRGNSTGHGAHLKIMNEELERINKKRGKYLPMSKIK